MKIAKKPKKKKSATHQPAKTPFMIVKMTNYLNVAVIIRTLYMVFGWREVRLRRFLESYAVLMQEISDHRCSVKEFINDTKELTGVDVYEFFDKVVEGNES